MAAEVAGSERGRASASRERALVHALLRPVPLCQPNNSAQSGGVICSQLPRCSCTHVVISVAVPLLGAAAAPKQLHQGPVRAAEQSRSPATGLALIGSRTLRPARPRNATPTCVCAAPGEGRSLRGVPLRLALQLRARCTRFVPGFWAATPSSRSTGLSASPRPRTRLFRTPEHS